MNCTHPYETLTGLKCQICGQSMDEIIKEVQAENKNLNEGIRQAIEIIEKGMDLMPLSKLRHWHGCRGFVEWWDQEFKCEFQSASNRK